jgi:hypothetical protein
MKNVGVFIGEKVWLRLFSSQTFSRKNTPTFLNLVVSHLPACEDGTEYIQVLYQQMHYYTFQFL